MTMKIGFKEIKSAVCGAAYIEEKGEGIIFHRFTPEQEDMYKTLKPGLTQISSTAGVVLSFKTDSDFLKIDISTESATIRNFFSVDIIVNGSLKGYIDNIDAGVNLENYLERKYTLGRFERVFELGSGEKKVEIHLPWSVKTVLNGIETADNSFFTPCKPEKSILVFGDSITIGENVLRPTNRYCSMLAREIGAYEFNKAIGGELFCPRLSELKDDTEPDYILVAYGTNDWAWGSREEFVNNCTVFFKNLIENYPFAKVFALTPIWRKDYLERSSFMPFKGIKKEIADIVGAYDNVSVIDGFELVPHNEAFFSDKRLHPNDVGERYIADGIIKFINKYGG